jgi:hypothetical protein
VHAWALVLPQVIEGALTILVLNHAVRRLAGPARIDPQTLTAQGGPPIPISSRTATANVTDSKHRLEATSC